MGSIVILFFFFYYFKEQRNLCLVYLTLFYILLYIYTYQPRIQLIMEFMYSFININEKMNPKFKLI